ncbi:MAG: UDP-N-acetylmuramate--L-alanine ligase [Alphaproteobacteria bacterium]|nr:UDP-N-acetylmuramate--L-alanine ligase [Alphaproteobacteria bacterium]
MKAMPLDTGTLHFVGIGGIGMSGIAEILHALGYKVQGSDIASSYNTKRLEDKGIRVLIGHAAENIRDKDGHLPAALVTSSAVKKDNPEVIAARAAKVPIVRRAEMLAELMRARRGIAISGTHGKTTTTSLVGQMLDSAGLDPTVVNGGIVNSYGTNVRLGDGEWMVVEADESDGTFTRLPAQVVAVTNMDPEHMDHYGSFENVRAAYKQFIQNLPFYGFAVLCIDHPEVQKLVADVTDRKVITYGFNPQADVRAMNLRPGVKGTEFDVTFAPWLTSDGKEQILRDVFLPAPGEHNVQNSLIALSVAQQLGVPAALMKKGLESFSGVKRRFTKTGEADGITFIDDYGHHPVEIATVLKTARSVVNQSGGKVIAVAQPHRYSRLHDLFDQFCTCFNEADSVLIADVYAAGESPIEGVDKDHLVEGIRAAGHRDVLPLPHKDDLAQLIADKAKPGDYVICLGAGDITSWAYALPEAVATLRKKAVA